MTLVADDVHGQVDERESHAVVAARLGGQQVTKMLGHTLRELSFTNNRGRKNGIGSSHTGCDAETVEPVEMRAEKSPDEQTCNQPAKRHDRDEQKGDRFPVALHVCLWQFDTDGETLYHEDDA